MATNVLTREDLREQLKRREIAPVYVLFGPEVNLRSIAAKTIADFSFSENDFRDLNESSFSLNVEGNLARALAAARQLPMMAARRVIRVTEVKISATGFRDTITEVDEPLLASYFESPSEHAVVIFIADELNGVRKMGKLLRERATAVEFTPLNDAQLAEAARSKIRAAGVTMDEAALRLLLANLGPDINRLSNEINKLAAASMPNGHITTALVDELVTSTREVSNFTLTDHLLAGRREQALATLKKILDDGAEPLALLGLLSYNYRRLLIVKDMMERGVERREVSNLLKMRYSDQEPVFAAARRASVVALRKALALLASADLAIKTSIGGSGPAGARTQIEVLVCELAAG